MSTECQRLCWALLIYLIMYLFFSVLAVLTFLAGCLFHFEGMSCVLLSYLENPWLLPTRYKHHLSQLWQLKIFTDIAQCPLRSKIPADWDDCHGWWRHTFGRGVITLFSNWAIPVSWKWYNLYMLVQLLRNRCDMSSQIWQQSLLFLLYCCVSGSFLRQARHWRELWKYSLKRKD